MGPVSCDGLSSAETAGYVNVFEGREGASEDLLCCLDHSLETHICPGAVGEPHCDAIG